MREQTPIPTRITLLQKRRVLEVVFDDGAYFELPCEYLRVYSPSAEVRGHGGSGAVLQVGKEKVNITGVRPVGRYAVKLVFDDGHDSGLYSWSYLYELGTKYQDYWSDYLSRLSAAGHARAPTQPRG